MTNARRVQFRRISVDRMYDEPFTGLSLSNLSEHINIVYGPNASGKSTLANAIQTTLLRSHKPYGKAVIDATLATRRGELIVRVDGVQREYFLNGETMDWTPELIRPESYHISLHDLLSAESDEKSFVEEIIRQASGGYDVGKAGKVLELHEAPSYKKRKIVTAFKSSSRRLRTIEKKQKVLDTDRKRLADLYDEIDEKDQALHRRQLLQKALAFSEAHQQWVRCDQNVAKYPPALRAADLRNLSDKPTQLEKANKDLAKIDGELEQLGRELAAVETAILQSSLPETGLLVGLLEQLRLQTQGLSDTDTDITRIKQNLVGLQREAEALLSSVSGAVTTDAAVQFGFEEVERLEEVVRRASNTKGRSDALQALEQLFRTDSDTDLEERVDQLKQAQKRLLGWLQAKASAIAGLQRVKLVLWIATLLTTISTLVVALGLGNAVGWSGLVPVALIVTALIWLQSTGAQDSEGSEHRRQFLELGITTPNAWEHSAVSARLTELLNERAGALLDLEKHKRWTARADECAKVRTEMEETAAQLAALRDKTGLTIDPVEPLYYVVVKILTYQDKMAQVAGAEKQLRQAVKRRAGLIAQINKTLTALGEMEIASHDEAAGTLEALRSKKEALLRDLQKRDVITTRLNDRTQQRNSVHEDKTKIFTDLGLNEGDTEGLIRLVDQGPELRELQQSEREARILRDKAEKELDVLRGEVEALKTLPLKDLKNELSALDGAADERAALQKTITEIEAKIEDAERRNDLEDALAEAEKKRSALAEEREQEWNKAVGHVIFKELIDYTREQGLPKVFTKAVENFSAVTSERYELGIRDNHSFEAYDAKREQKYELNQLSSATRVQLLLCVRIAFVETQEENGNHCFPLTLDEALANSDDIRAGTVIDTIAKLAEKRQIFYFTAQEDEVVKWKERAGNELIKVHQLTPAA